jgi:hypothetical protein
MSTAGSSAAQVLTLTHFPLLSALRLNVPLENE